jgi:hypothetical protein
MHGAFDVSINEEHAIGGEALLLYEGMAVLRKCSSSFIGSSLYRMENLISIRTGSANADNLIYCPATPCHFDLTI